MTKTDNRKQRNAKRHYHNNKKKSGAAKRAKRVKRDMVSFLSLFDIEQYRMKAAAMNRKFVLHVGPTNSGKTYSAIQALRQCAKGAYLGPLRLLALEMFDTLNEYGCLCELLTGEEFVRVEGAHHTSSTIELCNFKEEYDVVVIDEAQLIADPYRGGNWTKAIFLVNAKEVHLCLSPDAENLICKIIEGFGAEYEVHRHERLAPLDFTGSIGGIDEVQDGDAVIVFSRRAVLATAGELQNIGKQASVIYGALPPVSRREEVRKFATGENTVVVSTDAIGMGLSLPIKRVVFREVTKFDGEQNRPLTPSEIKQIAGRAGRYGIYDRGEVVTMAARKMVKNALETENEPLEEITIPFPKEAIETGFAFDKLFDEWAMLPFTPGFCREDMSEARYLYMLLGRESRRIERELLYDLITCPVDVKNDKLTRYWLVCAMAISAGEIPEMPYFNTDTLEGCELQYKAFDIRHQILRRIGIEEPCMDEKMALCAKINNMLLDDKMNYRKRCRRCGRYLPATYPYGICDKCHRKVQR